MILNLPENITNPANDAVEYIQIMKNPSSHFLILQSIAKCCCSNKRYPIIQ